MMMETKKILDPKIRLTATCVRGAGVRRSFRGGQHRNSRIRSPPTKHATSCATAPGCLVIDKHEPGGTSRRMKRPAKTAPISAVSARMPPSSTACRLWCVSDNLHKGAALNAIQIAEMPDQPQADQRQEKAA